MAPLPEPISKTFRVDVLLLFRMRSRTGHMYRFGQLGAPLEYEVCGMAGDVACGALVAEAGSVAD